MAGMSRDLGPDDPGPEKFYARIRNDRLFIILFVRNFVIFGGFVRNFG